MNKMPLDYTFIIPRWSTYNPNFYYFTGVDIDHSILLISKDEKIIFTNEMNYELCKKELGKKFEIRKMNLKEIKEELKKRNGKYLIDGSISADLFLQLRNKNMKLDYKELKKIREIKTKNEIEKIRKATEISRELIEKINVKNKFEYEIKNEILFKTIKRNVWEAFKPIIANSSNARFPHYNKYDSKITDYCLIDYGTEFEKYKSDISRCVGNLKEKKEEYEKLQSIVFEIADSTYSGVKIKDFVENVEKIVSKRGMKKFCHSIGHGIGLDVHEFPVLNSRNDGFLKENSVITLEPGQYHNNYGLRYEEMFIVGKNKLKKI